MSDADERSEAARALSRARWGSRRVDRLAAELIQRSDELSPEALEALRVAAVRSVKVRGGALVVTKSRQDGGDAADRAAGSNEDDLTAA